MGLVSATPLAPWGSHSHSHFFFFFYLKYIFLFFLKKKVFGGHITDDVVTYAKCQILISPCVNDVDFR
jgi:thiosulfate reductase cytochrome b subunit